MSRKSKSQWNFGELFPLDPARPADDEAAPAPAGPPTLAHRVLTVTELTLQVKRLLERQVGSVWVTGEVTNFRAQSSGHIYFTLKDAGAQLNCVLFRGEAVMNRSLLQDGQKILLQGDVTVYEARGQYQLLVRAVELQGVGALQIAFEKLKQKLAAEGLFARERKRPLPRYPRRIGLVTSPAGAAIRDVLHVVQRRHPALEIILAPCRVQGDGAAEEIAEAIRRLNEFGRRDAEHEMDLILVTRGGGSLEDLWAFNEEIVARAIFESALPVVSAVGHEIDFTISDFVADVRAATPSAAAEIITGGVFASRQWLAEAADTMGRRVRQRLAREREDFGGLWQRIARAHPRRRFNELLQQLDDLQSGLVRSARQGTRAHSLAWHNLATRLRRIRPKQMLKQRRELLHGSRQRLGELARAQLQNWQLRLAATETRLRLLGPEQVLSRGYSITMDARSGRVLRRAQDARPGQRLKTRLQEGEVLSKVQE